MAILRKFVSAALLLLPCACSVPASPLVPAPPTAPAYNVRASGLPNVPVPVEAAHVQLLCSISAQGRADVCSCPNDASQAVCAWALTTVSYRQFAPFLKDGVPVARSGVPVKVNYVAPSGSDAVVVLSCTITVEGRAENCRRLAATSQEFYKAAMDFVKKARYRPGIRNGVPVAEFDHRITVNFHADDDK